MEILLGNTAVREGYRETDDSPLLLRDRPDLGGQVTTIRFPDDVPADERLETAVAIWHHHSSAPPEWVKCDEDSAFADSLASRLANHPNSASPTITEGEA